MMKRLNLRNGKYTKKCMCQLQTNPANYNNSLSISTYLIR